MLLKSDSANYQDRRTTRGIYAVCSFLEISIVVFMLLCLSTTKCTTGDENVEKYRRVEKYGIEKCARV